MRPKKKAKVVPDLGKRFVQIAQISAVQQLAEVTGANSRKRGKSEEIELAGTCFG